MTEPGVEYTLDFPKYLDGYEAETEAKGYLVDLKVSAGELTFTFSVYDPTRLAQGVAEETAADGYFALTNLLVVTKVTRGDITRAVRKLAQVGFPGLTPDSQRSA